MKFSKKKTRRDAASENKPKALRKAAVLAAGLALAGCGDTINNYYYGPDAGRDAGSEMQVEECPNNESLMGRGWVNQGEALIFEGFKLQLDDISVWPTDMPPAALLSLLDSQDNTINYLMLRSGESELLELGKTYRVHVDEIQVGYTFGAKRADLWVMECTD